MKIQHQSTVDFTEIHPSRPETLKKCHSSGFADGSVGKGTEDILKL